MLLSDRNMLKLIDKGPTINETQNCETLYQQAI